jgi:phosphoglucomutase
MHMQEILPQVIQGLSGLAMAHDTRQTALRQLKQWLTEPAFEPYRPQLTWLIAQQRWSLLLDSFYRVLPFGTGGRRGPVGLGPNRFNAWTLASSVQGHVL